MKNFEIVDFLGVRGNIMASQAENLDWLITEDEENKMQLLSVIDELENGRVRLWERRDGGPQIEITETHLSGLKLDLEHVKKRLARYPALKNAAQS